MASTGVGGVGQSAAQYLQQLTGQQSASTDVAQGQGAKGAHHHHHHHGGGGGGGQQQVGSLLDTITNALQSTDASSDPNQVIEDTVAKLLQSGNSATVGGATNGVSASAVQAAGTQAANQPPFLQLLQSHGVSLQQFQADLLSAVKDAQNGKVNPATALQSLPPGSNLNLTA
ncbi:MAG TPA: hypothetical protein VGM76_12275 [Lacipirellulaceae bacterium]|jgi:hypothetical protein